ncbi:hypothetical protein [Haemophilus sp. SZY H51]|uniref:hypothetical protein n=1 Tax=Haemophilus sp. SZY H51 TaxID=3041427 RepID=UPI0025B0DB94|nr:hypothetical protein [Haemophilus sp. SZY H51]MDN3211522.1 hypothetical protein [Haemophilus sp. SZY H51]
MKEFNLDAALNGEPVMLRNGCKGVVYYKIPKEYVFSDGSNSAFPLKGLIFDEDGFIKDSSYFWTDNGFCNHESYHPNDIIGMWEEPKISIEDLPKPFKPKNGESYYYICGRTIEYMRNYAEVSTFDSLSAQNGQCFRTKEDAQKWLDFMKSMME